MLQQELFKRFPPFYIVIDYTAEKTFTDNLVEKFKDEKIEKINFNVASKKMLKEDGLNMMSQGYQFPNPEQLPNGPSMEQVKEWLRILDTQLRHEQVLATRSNKISFDHPEGAHNDLAIAWELSAHGCLRHMLKPVSGHHVSSSSGRPKRENANSHRSMFPELYRDGVRITDLAGMEVNPRQKTLKRKSGF